MTVEYVNDVPWGKAKFWFEDGSIQGQGTLKDEVPGGGWLVRNPQISDFRRKNPQIRNFHFFCKRFNTNKL